MTAITSKVQICNMALSHLGNYGTIEDIESPVSDKEIAFSLWYDVTRQAALRLLIPNFAMARRVVSKKATAPAFGYTYAYEYPSDCLKVLGFGEVDEKDLNYSVERGSDGFMEIQTDTDYSSGLNLRFIEDVEDVVSMTPDFQILLSWMLAGNTALDVTQKQQLADNIQAKIPMKISELSGINAQENPPVRKSSSNFKRARYSTPSRNGAKK